MTSRVEPRFFAVIPAAGTGSRFSTQEAKQYMPLLSSTVLEHSAARLLRLKNLQQLVIAIHSEDTRAALLPQLQDVRVHFVVGGDERSDSVLAALHALQDVATENDWVLVHDAARPCLAEKELQRLLSELSQDAVGGILAVPATDTLKQVADGVAQNTLDRRAIWQAQTPQMFRFGLLLSALQAARDKQRVITDEASAMEAAGHVVKVVEGARSNIKITYSEDLALAAFYLQQEQQA
ncbi:MAG TPA: 2-C-methyl-D-erythritol 4-phosphate cytidylyltransferase [Pseudomonadales bacterium]|jgi:2-C-methyl-D-erythritol 4-phosphate cytidylyltransferase|nr:2-C-methyl-D-erythritol 4-phosphate cytidylyltransferase [Pseudomonadales bacterium]HNI37128.1 2-C-methyl-D-erythritol 4-phosphate cytidylyltransferase [Pseudomonadales bacterium]HNL91709.1 2-C-methyl-D-erythritol 4-phosphate cytidylyltransferase [Pseudomonadales bacterium]HNN86102.1 2-C-methyl-D-erythritol 4-phosphate cytidylyltransferase [Pseudomonadales bacterium]